MNAVKLVRSLLEAFPFTPMFLLLCDWVWSQMKLAPSAVNSTRAIIRYTNMLSCDNRIRSTYFKKKGFITRFGWLTESSRGQGNRL